MLSRTPMCLAIFVLSVLSHAHMAEAKFDPPRITYVINPADAGAPGDDQGARIYYINKGVESSINKGDILNVYREKRPARNMPPIRLFIGTMTISTAQHGSSMGEFAPNSAAIANPIIKYKSAMKGDIVVPRLVIETRVLFDPGMMELKPEAGQELEKVATFVRHFSPYKLVIEGHTDSDGESSYNQRLSVSRAEAIRRILVQEYEFITLDMVEARGYGEQRPFVPNTTPANKTLNRRNEVVVWE